MIEDLQDELQTEQTTKKKDRPVRKGRFLMLAFIIWILYATVIILSYLPSMIRSVRESDIVNLIQNIDQMMEVSQSRESQLCFVIPKADGSAIFVTVPQRTTRTGATEYHDAIEGLLKGPGQQALGIGAISFIEKGTTLIGLTVSQNTAFVNLSESFMSSGSNWGPSGLDIACKQITKTLQAIDKTIRNVVILVDGTELSI